MIYKLFFASLLVVDVISYPQSIRIPDLNVLSPQEVNSLQHNHQTRSISTETKSPNTIEDTVKEVEAIIKSNPALPRLTRGEILDLLENITKTDSDKVNILEEVRDPKAIMVVMPFTPSNSDANNIEELYTKAPVTQIIGAEPFKKPETEQSHIDTSRRKPARTRRPPVTTTTPPTTQSSETISESHQKKVNLRRRRPTSTTTESPPTTYRPRTRSPTRRKTTTRYPNHKYPEDQEETFKPSNGIRIIKPPKLSTKSPDEINSDLHFEEDTKQEVFTNHQKTTTNTPLAEEINIPEHLRPLITTMNLQTALNGEQTNKKNVPTIDESEKIKTMLESIGVLFPSSTTIRTTTTTLVPDVNNVADTLSPEMKDLLMSFGLIPNPNEQIPKQSENSEIFYPSNAEIKPESYGGFKPLPEDTSSRNEMEGILASFGLLRNGRNGKSVVKKEKKQQELNFDIVPDQFKSVLTDIGLTDQYGKRFEKKHVFNPADSQYATEEELEKLNKLLDVIKKLESLNGTATDDDLKKIDLDSIKDLVGSLNNVEEEKDTLVPLDQQKNSPNPINELDSIVSKNEVKRQESTTTVEPTTVENTKIKDLEDSFGGQSETVTEASIPEETTTEVKRTGFYYLVDWNSFLDIDDQKGKRVNLRFQPTIGDPKRFLSVSVP